MLRKVLIAALWLPLVAFAQSYPSPTLKQFTSPSTGQFYAGSGASISRIYDRLFVGSAALNNGTQVASQPDWLTQFQISTGRGGGFMQLSNLAVLNGSIPDNQNTFVTAAQSQYLTSTGNVIGAISMGVNNNTGHATNAYAGYSEAYRMSGTAGGAYGLEIDPVNYAGDVTTDPYQQASGQTIALQLAAGAELSPTGQFPSQAAINIQNNNSTFDKGIVFGATSLTGDTGTSGSAIAIALGFGHALQWYYSGSILTSSISSTGTTAAGAIQQKFSENTVSFNNASNAPIFQSVGVSSGVNGIQAVGASTGNPVQLQAIGTDTNIPIQLNGKGTAGSQIQGFTDGSSAPAGKVGEYVTNSATAVSLSSSTTANITSISLTAGDWDVESTIKYNPAATTTISNMAAGVSTTSATLGALGSYFQSTAAIGAGAGQTEVFPSPVIRVSVASTTTVYAVAFATFATSTLTADAFIRARRVR